MQPVLNSPERKARQIAGFTLIELIFVVAGPAGDDGAHVGEGLVGPAHEGAEQAPALVQIVLHGRIITKARDGGVLDGC